MNEIRRAREHDIPRLLPLMRGLAVFERYVDTFTITEEILREQGFRRSPPDFGCFVADSGDDLVGMLVFYLIPFTAQAKPTMIVKELFVSEQVRSSGIGEALMRSAAREAVALGCGAIKWQVAPWNEAGIRFYERLGATQNHDWLDFGCSESAMRALASDKPT